MDEKDRSVHQTQAIFDEPIESNESLLRSGDVMSPLFEPLVQPFDPSVEPLPYSHFQSSLQTAAQSDAHLLPIISEQSIAGQHEDSDEYDEDSNEKQYYLDMNDMNRAAIDASLQREYGNDGTTNELLFGETNMTSSPASVSATADYLYASDNITVSNSEAFNEVMPESNESQYELNRDDPFATPEHRLGERLTDRPTDGQADRRSEESSGERSVRDESLNLFNLDVSRASIRQFQSDSITISKVNVDSDHSQSPQSSDDESEPVLASQAIPTQTPLSSNVVKESSATSQPFGEDVTNNKANISAFSSAFSSAPNLDSTIAATFASIDTHQKYYNDNKQTRDSHDSIEEPKQVGITGITGIALDSRQPLQALHSAMANVSESVATTSTSCEACPFAPSAWFNRKQLHPTVAELVYWQNPKKSGIVFASGLILLLSLTCFSVISVVAYSSLLALSVTLSFRIYKNVLQAVQKTNEGHPFKEYLEIEITPSNERVHQIVDSLLNHVNCAINKLRSVFLVEDIIDSLKFVILFWCLTYVGSWFNGLTLVILAYLASFSLPKVYEMNKTQIDQYLKLACTQINDITSKVRAKIPFPSKKEKDN